MKQENEGEVNYLENFDKIFGTKTDKKIKLNMPMLHVIFDNFREDVYSPSKKQDKLRSKKIELYDKLKEILTEEQWKVFMKYYEVESEMATEVEEQLFLFGYIVASELSEEVKSNIKKNNNTKKV